MKNQKQEKLSYIPLNKLDPSPLNSNEMTESVYEKVKLNIKKSGRYPAAIVRPKKNTDRYEILDGWHRRNIVSELGHTELKCEIWDIDDKQAKLLLATLNRLKGTDDTNKRARLLSDLYDEFDNDNGILELIPESERSLSSLLSTMKNENAIFDEETERGLIEEKLLQAGIDNETAQNMADTYKIPNNSSVWIMKFVFKDISQYNKAIEYFGKKGNPDDLVSLIENYGETTGQTIKHRKI